MTTAPRTWVVGETVTAAMLNAEIRDQNNSIFGAWTAYTPAWTAVTTAPALGDGTLVGRYMKIGRIVHCHINLTAGAATTYGSGGWTFSLPVQAAAVGTGSRVGEAQALGASRFGGQTVISPTDTLVTPFLTTTSAALNQAAAAVPFAWASGNALRMTFTYEAAS